MLDYPYSTDEFDLNVESFEAEQEELFPEPEEDFDRDNWYAAMEELAAEATPDDWWQDQLNYARDGERLKLIVDELVKQGCRRADLLEALQAITASYWDPLPTRQQLLNQADRHLKLADMFPLSSGNDFQLTDWAQMQGLMLRCAEHLKRRADTGKLDRDALRRERVLSLLILVRRETGRPHHGRLSELLLALVGHRILEPPTLRKMDSRRGVTTVRPLRPALRRRSKSQKGRPVFASADKAGTRWVQAQIDVGNLPERWHSN